MTLNWRNFGSCRADISNSRTRKVFERKRCVQTLATKWGGWHFEEMTGGVRPAAATWSNLQNAQRDPVLSPEWRQRRAAPHPTRLRRATFPTSWRRLPIPPALRRQRCVQTLATKLERDSRRIVALLLTPRRTLWATCRSRGHANQLCESNSQFVEKAANPTALEAEERLKPAHSAGCPLPDRLHPQMPQRHHADDAHDDAGE